MKGKIYHLCYTSHGEVLCRKYLDYCMLFNCIAQATIGTDAQLLAYAIMSTHVHLIVITEQPAAYIQRIRSSYTQMFNRRYRRKGTLGEPSFYSVELIGRRHVTAAISYVLRNPVHHELTSNPYDYEFSSIGLYFRKETRRPEDMRPKKATKPFATIIRRDNRQRLPEGLIFDETGQIEPSQLVNSAVVEGFFGSYAAFDYGLQRRDYQVWETEQLQDRDGQSAITVGIIEPYLSGKDLERILTQSKQWAREKPILDMDICAVVDEKYVSGYGKESYAQLTDSEKVSIADSVKRQYGVGDAVLSRCLGIVLCK